MLFAKYKNGQVNEGAMGKACSMHGPKRNAYVQGFGGKARR
jgi:hypothetical protein